MSSATRASAHDRASRDVGAALRSAPEDGELQLNIPHGSNWSQSCPLNLRPPVPGGLSAFVADGVGMIRDCQSAAKKGLDSAPGAL
jgi:hypothetical protein